MRLSIITINYNNKNGFQKTIDSVISQTFTDFEWIVIDGGSTDGSKELIEQYKSNISYWVSEPDKGIYNAMNKGIRVANGEYCLFLNSGDRLHDSKVLEYVLMEFDGTDFIYGNICLIDSNYQYIKVRETPAKMSAYYLLEDALCHQCVFIKTELLKQRPYDETLKIVADWEEMFYEYLINKRTYKHINIIISDYLCGGLSDQNGSLLIKERRLIRNKYLNQKEQDIICVGYLSQMNDDKSQMKLIDMACTAFMNCLYSEKEYNEIFSVCKDKLYYGGSWCQKFLIWMSLHGCMNFARFCYRKFKSNK